MGTFSRRQLPTAKRTGKRQGALSAARGKSGWPGSFRRLGAFGCDGQKKKEGRPFRAGPLLVRLCGSLPCRCSYTIAHFTVVVNNFLVAAGAFVGCCIRVACGRPLEVRPRPRAGGGWAPAGLVALQVTTLRFRRGWAFRCLTTSGGCGVSVAAAATGRSP